ncbi:MAG: hypothetical protein ACK40G_17260 [Cytophagaceae bacterium]
MKKAITIEIEANSELEAASAAKAIQSIADKMKASGVIKLNDTYEKDFMIRTAVNKKLGIK